ncbi:MAG: site-2 protease family protein [Minisyncoccota bacterium]
MSIIIFLIILSVLVVVHEAGHLWAAKSGGIRVDEFGLGFPPKIKKLFNWRGTDFFLNILPFGGYVKIHGENPIEGEVTDTDSFMAKSYGRQILVLVAGVLANFALAWLLFSVVQMIGIESQDGFVKRGFFDAIWHGLLTTGMITWLTVVAIFELMLGALTGTADLTGVVGPVGLVGLVGTVSSAGFVYLLYFTALISVNLAIINLVPLPALDGGRVLLVLVEWVRGEKISPKVFNVINLASFALLIIIMVLITIRDVGQLI